MCNLYLSCIVTGSGKNGTLRDFHVNELKNITERHINFVFFVLVGIPFPKVPSTGDVERVPTGQKETKCLELISISYGQHLPLCRVVVQLSEK